MENIFSLAAVFLPIAIAFFWRMHVEEEALQAALENNTEPTSPKPEA